MFLHVQSSIFCTFGLLFSLSSPSWSALTPQINAPETSTTSSSDESIPDYFLTPNEITDSRNGFPRTTIRPYTLTGNRAKLLINGDDFFESLKLNLEKSKFGDFIWMTGWDIDAGVMLQPDPDHPVEASGTQIINELLEAINRGVKVRILLNWNALGPLKAIEFCRPLNKAAHKTVCTPDNRHNSHFGSLHQKAWVLSRENEVIAYVGSMDVSAGRYDSKAHSQDPKWQSQPPFPIHYWGWTGGMVELGGEVALDVANHLFDQLTDPAKPFKGYTLAKTDKPEQPVGRYTDPVKTQVLLTAGPLGGKKYGYYSNWAPEGETSLLASTIKAIKIANRYIYISDQFLWYPPIMDAIAERLDNLEAVLLLTDSAYSLDYFFLQRTLNLFSFRNAIPPDMKLVEKINNQRFNNASNSDPDIGILKRLHAQLKTLSNINGIDIDVVRNTKFYYQRKAWSALNPEDPKVSAYTLVKEKMLGTPPAKNVKNIIYTHWKVLIIDDEFAIIGTGGSEQSGMTNDVDMSIALYDSTLVSAMRRRLWSEHLNIDKSDPRLTDPLNAIKNLWPAISIDNGRVRKYWPKETPHYDIYDDIFQLFEPCGLLDQSKCQKLGPSSDRRFPSS